MTIERSFISVIILKNGNKSMHNLATVLLGSALLTLVAQISIPLSFTPVPITGQTFGVALVSLLWGKKRGVGSVASYLFAGGIGLPVFASGASGINIGPTSGYLVGMLAASYLMGFLADKGWTLSFWKTWIAAFCGSFVTFLCGAIILSFYIPLNTVLAAGVIPFLPGDFIKTLLVCFIVRNVAQTVEQRS